MLWKYLKKPILWVIVGVALVGLYFIWPSRGDDSPEETPVPVASNQSIPVTNPPPTLLDLPTTTTEATNATTIPVPAEVRNCRVAAVPHEFLLGLDTLTAELADISDRWDARDGVTYRETVASVEEWLNRAAVMLADVPVAFTDDTTDLEQWTGELLGHGEAMLEWLQSNASGSANKRRDAVQDFVDGAQSVPHVVIPC